MSAGTTSSPRTGRGLTKTLVAAVVLLAAAGAVDIAAHALHATSLEQPAHVLVLVGMVATLATVVVSGSSQSRSTRHD